MVSISENETVQRMVEGIRKYTDRISRRNWIIIVVSLFVLITLIGVYNRYLYFDFTSLLLSSLYLGALYLCLSLGLTLTYKIIGFANFSHAEYFLVGAYVGVSWTIFNPIEEAKQTEIFPVIFLAFLSGGIVALLSDLIVFRPLRKRGSSPETLMISSIGVGIVIRNVISVFFGGAARYYRWYDFIGNEVDSTYQIMTIRIGGRKELFGQGDYFFPKQYLITITVTLILVSGLIIMLQYSKLGKALRATSDNKDLAESSGINTELMVWIVWFIGGGLAAIAGLMYALSFFVIPYTGFLFLLPAFAVVVFGGVGSVKGSIFASLIIALVQNSATSYLRGLEKVLDNYDIDRGALPAYQVVVPFVIIIFVLMFRPYGLMGEEEN